MTDFMQRIYRYKDDEVAEAKSGRPSADLEREARDAAPARGFIAAIESRLAEDRYALIAEVKKASPSKGLIRAEFDPSTLARAYAAGGAACLSVLTDTPSFQGSPEHIAQARDAVSLPVLRKDFMIDPYQVLQARAWGADCVLIILALVNDATVHAIEDTATELGMDVVVEVHDDEELARAIGMRARLVGVNNRDLMTLETTLTTSERLAPAVPPDRIVIGESGISTPADLARLAAVGISTFLVGESLMRNPDVETATRALLAPTVAAKQRSSV